VDKLEALRFRRAFGLREDEAWIVAVAADPTSRIGLDVYGVPLLPWEYSDLLRRTTSAADIARTVASYGAANPDSWGGMFIDQRSSSAVVAQFTNELTTHKRRLTSLLPAGAQFQVRTVRWSLADLRRFVDEVEDARTWFTAIGAELFAADLDELANRVDVRFRSPDPGDAVAIREHFDEAEWMELEWMAPPWDGPKGGLVVMVVDPSGRPLPHLMCNYAAEDPRASAAEGEVPTGEDGTCKMPNLPAVSYRIEIGVPIEDTDKIVAETRAVVRPESSTVVRVTVESP
jgi:hypothetical protein